MMRRSTARAHCHGATAAFLNPPDRPSRQPAVGHLSKPFIGHLFSIGAARRAVGMECNGVDFGGNQQWSDAQIIRE
jgi:hypothetical protein